MFYLVHTPWWLKKIYPGCTWDIGVEQKKVFLTFDDGPHEQATPFVLEQLEKFGYKATFFCIGKNVLDHPGLFQQIKAAGHSVGNHTMNHVNGWKTKDEKYWQEMLLADRLIGSNLFRPPYGRVRKSQVRQFKRQRPGMKIVMWNILSGDFDISITGDQCYQNVIRYARPGTVIVFHDSAKALPRLEVALPKLLKWLQEGGYTSVGIPEKGF